MATNFAKISGRIRRSIVGIGFANAPTPTTPPSARIFGSGFFVTSSGWIMTNKHVVEPVLDQKTGTVRKGATAFVFTPALKDSGEGTIAGVMMAQIEQVFIPSEPVRPATQEDAFKFKGLVPSEKLSRPAADIAFCRIRIAEEMPKEVLPFQPLKIDASAGVCEGLPIGIFGFPQGLAFPYSYSKVSHLQITPLLQVGVISGVLPFPGVEPPDVFIINIFVNGGSSGSPLFTEAGDVIGIVFATRMSFSPLTIIDSRNEKHESNDVGTFHPSSLGLAVPSGRFPK